MHSFVYGTTGTIIVIGEAFLNESQGDIGSLKSSVESLFDGFLAANLVHIWPCKFMESVAVLPLYFGSPASSFFGSLFRCLGAPDFGCLNGSCLGRLSRSGSGFGSDSGSGFDFDNSWFELSYYSFFRVPCERGHLECSPCMRKVVGSNL